MALFLSGRHRSRSYHRGGMAMKYVGHIDDIAVDEVTPYDVMVSTTDGDEPADAGEECQDGPAKASRDDYRKFGLLGFGDSVAKSPERWFTVQAYLRLPEKSITDLATILGMSRQTVYNHLKSFEDECCVGNLTLSSIRNLEEA